MRYWGCHVSVAGGLAKGIANGSTLGVNSIQIHPSPPQRWNRRPFAGGIEDKFIEAKKKSKIEKVFLHSIYLINLANPDPENIQKCRSSLIYYLDLDARIKGNGVVLHVGSNNRQENPEDGYKLAIESLNAVLAETPKASRLLLEVSAGSGSVIGSRMEELARIYEKLDQKKRTGFALDSQHMWASGYNFRDDLAGIVKEADHYFGLENIELIHLNDSISDCGSKVDRHANLGEGLIGEKALKAFFNHPKLKSIPFVLETPALKDMETAAREVKVFKKYLSRKNK